MLANRVNETSATTGTGDLTLAGAVTNFRTFTDRFMIDERFSYTIDDEAGVWETGVGYLSGTTTLVRETVLDNSSGTTAKISFTGTLQVYVSNTAHVSATTTQGMSTEATLDYKIVKSGHLARTGNTQIATVGTRVHFQPFLLDYSGRFDALTTAVRTVGSAGDIFLGLYTRDSGGLPDKRIVTNATSLDPEVSGIQHGTFTEQSIPMGWYFIAFTCDVNVTVSSDPNTYTRPPHLGVDGLDFFDLQGLYYIDGSLTVLPVTVGAQTWTAVTTSNVPTIALRATT